MTDETGVFSKLDEIEKSLNELKLSQNHKERPLADLRNDWEPFIEINIGSEKFLAYCDLGSTIY